MQAYRGLPMLTNQPSAADQAAVPHHLIGVWPLDHRGSVAEFGELARAAIDDVLARGCTPIVAGGTGLYLRAALSDMRPPAQPAPGVRERYERMYDRDGAEAAHGVLQTLDAPAAAAVHPNDRRRVVRALELQEAGESLTGGGLWRPDLRRPTALFGLQLPPEPAPPGSPSGRGRCSMPAWWRRCARPSTAARSRKPPAGSTACKT